MDKNEVNKLLRRKLQVNYEAYMRLLNSQSPPSLIEQAAEIAAAKKVYDLTMDGSIAIDPETLGYLLRFDNPLAVLRDQYIDSIDFDLDTDIKSITGYIAEKDVAEWGKHELDAEHQPMKIGEMKLC